MVQIEAWYDKTNWLPNDEEERSFGRVHTLFAVLIFSFGNRKNVRVFDVKDGGTQSHLGFGVYQKDENNEVLTHRLINM